MRTLIHRQSQKAGLPPGSLVRVGEEKAEKVKITVIDYKDEHFEQREIERVEDCLDFKDKPTVTWINVDGVHDTETVRRLGECYQVHPLTLEDILNTEHRPKMEDFGHYIFITLKMLGLSPNGQGITVEQVSLVVGQGFVISFQEATGDVFDPVRERIRRASGRMRSREADYLAYALIDAVIDEYFVILESLGEEIEGLEDELVTDPGQGVLESIFKLRREMVVLRRSIWPLREAISALEKSESGLISQGTRVFLRDLYDHTISVVDTVETFREMLAALLDLYLSGVSNKMNQVMKVLTVVATIFIPLTFIAGIYGMNFENMPELKWSWGYFAVWLIMAAIAGLMLLAFRRKKWL